MPKENDPKGAENLLPSVFDYDDFRAYLRDTYRAKKARMRAFSYRYFARNAGLKSPMNLKRVMEGDRNLKEESIDKFAKALKLNKEEGHFFKSLVLLNQAKTVEEKQKHAKALLGSRLYKKARPTAKRQYEYWSGWHNIVIREMVGLPDFQEDPEWIARKLTPKISREEAEKSLKDLEELGMIRRNAQGQLEQVDTHIASGDMVVYSSLGQFHRQMIQKGGESIDRFTAKDRQVSAVTFGLTDEGAQKMRVMIQKFRQDLVALAHEEKNPQKVFQVNFQLFPVTDALAEQGDAQ